MIKCTKCGVFRLESDFNFKVKAANRLQSHCKACTRQYVQNHYVRNRDYYLLKARKRNKLIREKLRKYLWSYLKTHPCVDCGEKDPVVLEFDHFKDKLMDVSRLVAYVGSTESIQREVDKCEVRCANCHRRKTAIQYGWYKNLPL